MNTKQFGIIALASIALLVLLGCVEQKACTADAKICPDGTTVSRSPALNCEFNSCPQTTGGEQQPAGAAEQVVGPEAYANEQQAFDAIAGEVEGMPELSDAELEALLGG